MTSKKYYTTVYVTTKVRIEHDIKGSMITIEEELNSIIENMDYNFSYSGEEGTIVGSEIMEWE